MLTAKSIFSKFMISSYAVFFTLPAVAGLFGASSSDKVKSAVINSSTGQTYEQFFSGYKYAKSVEWSESKIDGGRVTAAIVKIVYKNVDNFRENLKVELETRRKEEIAELELQIRNEQKLKVQRIDQYEENYKLTGNAIGLKVRRANEIAAEKTVKELKDSGILPQRDYCSKIRCIRYSFGSSHFERDLQIEMNFLDSELNRINDTIANDIKSIETIPASNTYRLKSAKKDLASSQLIVGHLQRELNVARAVLTAYPSVYSKHLADAQTLVHNLYADEREKAKTFIHPENISKLEALKKPVQELDAGPWADLREISDAFVIVPFKDGRISYQGGETCFTWADGKRAVIPRRSRSMETVILQAIQNQKPIWTASDDLPVIGYKYIESAYNSRE